MKNLIRTLLLVVGLLAPRAGAQPRSPEELVTAFRSAVQEQSAEKLSALYYTAGLSAEDQAQAQRRQQAFLSFGEIEKVTLQPLPDDYISTHVFNGQKLEPSYPPAGSLILSYSANANRPAFTSGAAYALVDGKYYLVAEKHTALDWRGPPDKPLEYRVLSAGLANVRVQAKWITSGVELERRFHFDGAGVIGQYFESVTLTNTSEDADATLVILEDGKQIFMSDELRGQGQIEYVRPGSQKPGPVAAAASGPAPMASPSALTPPAASNEQARLETPRPLQARLSTAPTLPRPALARTNSHTRLAIGSLGLAARSREGALADLLASELSGQPSLELVERRELDAVLKEASLSRAGLVRAADAVRVGSLVRADAFLLGGAVSLQGTNLLVVRLVDARTGVMLDVHVFQELPDLPALAGEIAQFVHTATQAPTAEPRDYLAIGVIQNLGINNRFAEFPAQMRGYLAAHLSARVTMLEREVVSFLAEELRMDQAGLTERAGGAVPPVQFGFWIVDGFYQSYEVSQPEVQLKLRVERVLGGQQSYTLQGKPEEALFQRICESVGHTLDHPETLLQGLPPSREGELKALEARAKQLVDYEPASRYSPARIHLRTAANPDKVLNTLDESTRVFESMLLLAPDDNAAKMRLAACLVFNRAAWAGQEREDAPQCRARAQEFYREVIASADPAWSMDAAMSLAHAYGGLRGVDLLREFEVQVTNPKQKQEVRAAACQLLQHLAGFRPAELLLPYFRAELLEGLKATETSTNEQVRVDFEPVLFPYRFQPQEREAVINQLLPDLLTNFPDLEPYLLLEAAGEQVSSNSPVTASFLASLRQCEAQPERVRQPRSYFTHLSSTLEDEKEVKMHGGTTLLQRMFGNGAYLTLTNAVLARARAAEKGVASPLTPIGRRMLADTYVKLQEWSAALALYQELPDVDARILNECRQHLQLATASEALPDAAWKNAKDIQKVELAYQCMAREQWTTAQAILESMGHRTVRMNTGGPWGYAFTPVLPAVVAEECRAKAGKPKVTDPMRFELGEKPYVYFVHDGQPRTYSMQVEGEDLWLGTYSQVKRFRGPGTFEALQPTELHEFKRSTRAGNTAICVGPEFVWAGTADDGLFEVDRRTGACRHFTMREGLFVNGICALYLQGQTLWIGYCNAENGALGTLDVATHRFSAFTPALPPGAGTSSRAWYQQDRLEDPHQPPQHPVVAMLQVDPGEMWFAVQRKGLQRFRVADNAWSCVGSRIDFRQNPRYMKATANGLEAIGWLNLLSDPGTPLSGMVADPAQGLVLVTVREIDILGNEASSDGGLVLYDYHKHQAEWLHNQDGLPANDVTAVALEGRFAWVGGRGFVAVLDVPTRKVVRVAYVSAARVQQIQLGKRYAYVQISCGKEARPEDAGDAWTGVYRLERAAVESRGSETAQK